MSDGRLDRRGVNVYVRPTSLYVRGPVGKAVQFNNMTAVSHCWPLIDSTNSDTCSSSSLSNRPPVTATGFTGSVTGTVVTGYIADSFHWLCNGDSCHWLYNGDSFYWLYNRDNFSLAL